MNKWTNPDSPEWGPLFALCDSSVSTVEKPRLSAQCQAILDRLRQGPVSNAELSLISLKYTSRISDLRKNGYQVGIASRDHSTGLVVYQLTGGHYA